jgi:hypothetical protein
MLLCSPISMSLCLHLPGIYDLLFFSTGAPQPSFSVSLSCCTLPCTFFASTFHAMCPNSIPCTIPLHAISVVAHSSFYTLESLTTTTTHLFFVLRTYSLCAPFCMLSLPYFCMLSHVLLHVVSMSSALPDHHDTSSASLAVRSICQLPLRTVFIPLVDSLRLFSFSGNHSEVSSSPLAETISRF